MVKPVRILILGTGGMANNHAEGFAIEGVELVAGVDTRPAQLAARAMGAPSARGSGFEHAAGDALVLILRECLHHLGFDAVHLAA